MTPGIATMAERFYLKCDLAPGMVVLRGAEAHHLATVCRLRPGDQVCLFNGNGREYPAHVEAVGRREATLEVLRVAEPSRERPFRLEVAAPLPKGDRGAFLVEKLTEIGATRFVPLVTERSVVVPRESRLEKLQRQVIEASKQCGRNVLVEIGELTPWPVFAGAADQQARRLLAHPGGQQLRQEAAPGDVVLAVGPEGGFTGDEVELAARAGWQVVSLGPRILRVETAALVLAVLVGGVSE